MLLDLLPLLLLLATTTTTTVLAYHPPPRPSPSSASQAPAPSSALALHTRGSFLTRSSIGASAAAAALLLGLPPTSNAASPSSTAPAGPEGGPTLREKGRPALLEALVYLPKGVNYWGELLPGLNEEVEEGGDAEATGTGTEALFLTASYQGKLVLGARVPMEGIMFPFLAQFYEGNILGGAKGWQAAKAQDLVVRARVCASGVYPPCGTPLLKAASLSKFFPEVRDPNNPRSEEVIARNVRVGASLMLQPVGEATTLQRWAPTRTAAAGAEGAAVEEEEGEGGRDGGMDGGRGAW